MRRTVSNSLIIVALLAGVAAGYTGTKDVSRQKQSEKKAQPPKIDTAAIQALDRMSAYLRAQRSFVVQTRTSTDYVMDSGQKITESASGDLMVRRPDHVRANVISDRKQRQFFYDGKTLTLFSPRQGYYATVPALPTIKQTANLIEDKYGLQLPLVDLFRFGTDQDPAKELTGAIYVGPTQIDGVDVDQYAFRQPGLDWQIWIQRGNQPLPRRMLLTTTDDPARPEHMIDMAWNLNASIPDAAFAFVPPPNSTKIAIVEVDAQKRIEQQQQARRTRAQQR